MLPRDFKNIMAFGQIGYIVQFPVASEYPSLMSLPEIIEKQIQQINYQLYIHSTDKKRKEDTKSKNKEKEEKEKYILCGTCENKITQPTFKLEINGAFRHTFLNPEGHVFHIGCFQEADGCAVFGEPTSEWSWFKEFTWRNARCNQCLKQLGWYYHSHLDQFFFGLILDSLI